MQKLMTKIYLALFALMLSVPLSVGAADAPLAPLQVDASHVLRGTFVEEHQVKGLNQPMRTSGHFTLAPAFGLLWNIEKPMATTTIVTHDTSVQDIGGLAIKLPIKNLQHLYDTITQALTGNWSTLENDFSIQQMGDSHHWQMLLTALPSDKSKTPYKTITISGGRFIESIAMTSKNDSYETLSFTEESLAQLPLNAIELAAFHEAYP
jgi:hypothetical protein